MRRTRLLLGVLIATALLLTGCAAEPDSRSEGAQSRTTESPRPRIPGAPPTTTLAEALAATPATEAAKTYFGFSDLSAFGDKTYFDNMPAVGHGLQDAPTMGLDGFGPHLLRLQDILPPPVPGATATTVSVPPNSATRFTGVPDPAAAYGRASGERSDLQGGTLIVRRADFEVDLADQELHSGPLLARLNVIWFDRGTVITGTNREAVETWVANSGTTLLEHYDGVAECLGDAVGALVVSADHADAPGDIGIGLGGTVDETVQTLCVRSSNVRASVEEIEERLANGRDLNTNIALSESIPTATVEDAGAGWVRVRTLDARPNIFARMLTLGGLRAITG